MFDALDVVIAGWEFAAYTAQESDLGLSICAIQMGAVRRDVQISIFPISQSATGEYNIVFLLACFTQSFSWGRLQRHSNYFSSTLTPN